MTKEILKLKTDIGLGENDPAFKDIEIGDYSFKSPRMGMPTLTAELMWPTCLDDEWTHREYATLRGEKYYIRQVQTSEISNENVIKYKHSLEFKSEREQLTHVYFYDVVPSDLAPGNVAGHDRPNTNSSKFKLFGTIYEYADRLNCALRYAGIGDSILKTKTSLRDGDVPVGDGYCVVVSDFGDGDLEQSQEIEFEGQWLWDAIAMGFEKYEIPFSFHGKKIIFNEYIEPIDHVFKYGFDESLLAIQKENANAKIVNRITFKGSSENIPYHYPNETEYGEVELSALPTNKVLAAADFAVVKPSRLVGKITSDSPVTLGIKASADAAKGAITYKATNSTQGEFSDLNIGQWYEISDFTTIDEYYGYSYRIAFTTEYDGNVTLKEVLGQSWDTNQAPPYNTSSQITNLIGQDYLRVTNLTDALGNSFLGNAEKDGDKIILSDLPAGEYVLELNISWVYDGAVYWWRIDGINFDNKNERSYYWQSGDDKTTNLLNWGVECSVEPAESMLGDGFRWAALSRMPFQENLMPPKYRETLGAERFYNALNDTYKKKDGTYYTFKNVYVEGDPVEYIYSDDTITPTIEGVTNSKDELFGVIAGVAFDVDDNDSLKGDTDADENDSANYAHSFFYIRLNKFDGYNGFDLFKSASQTDAMTIQMTSGKCNGCKFKIQVVTTTEGDVEEWSNPVQTLCADGNIVTGTQSQIINKKSPQEWQQDTTKNYIWIAVQKDAETFGIIMPNRTNEYLPEIGDTFNIINIDLPQGYISAAEKRGEYAMLDFLEQNNEEKFNFSITASRIFFAENPSILAELDENSRIKVEYDGHTYEQYVSEFSIDCKKEEALPDIKLTLSESLESSGSFVEDVVAQAVEATNVGAAKNGSGNGGLSTELADTRYLRKDKDERTAHRITSDTAFQVGDFVSGSTGGIMYVDPETGQSSIEVDYFKARVKAIFDTLEIAHVRSIGGKMTITPGGSVVISFVVDTGSAYRCYFKQQDDDQGADCRFTPGDDVYCESFNVSNGKTANAANKFYWRKVLAVSNDGAYIELSKINCAYGSGEPEIGDTICQLGSAVLGRQSAIVLSTVDTASPNITLYEGVNDFSLVGKEMIEMGVDPTTRKVYFHVYGNAYLGDKSGASYIKYDSLLKLLEVKAKLSVQTTVGDDTLEEYIEKVSPPVQQEDIEEFVNNIVDPRIQDIQKQIDGVIETWFFNGEPTLDNYPAKDWATDAFKTQHLGDLYYDNDTGAAYRFSFEETDKTYFWNVITDEAITKALAAAQAAQDTADGKRRIFTSQPEPPYDEGDLWVNATYPESMTSWSEREPISDCYYNDILICVQNKPEGGFNISNWQLASAYTDDTTAREALNQIAGYSYLKEALSPDNTTQIDGGLIMSTLISLGYTDTLGRHTMAGINGSWVTELGGRTIGSWWGGPMTDLFNADGVKQILATGTYATSLVRMDGSAYFANGNIGFNKDGSGWLGNETTGIKFSPTGALTVGSGMTIDVSNVLGLQTSLESIANWQLGFDNFFVPCDENGVEISWQDAALSDGLGGKRAKYLKAKATLCSTGDLVAYKDSDFSGGSSGGGLDLAALEEYLTDNSYATQDWVSAHFNNYVLTKSDVESVLTGDITSHVHSQYLTKASLDNYVTLDTVQTISGIKTFIGNVIAPSFVRKDGTSSQFLMANGAVTTKKTMGAVSKLDWVAATENYDVPTMSVIAHWDGRYNDTSSNLLYCKHGQIGTIVTAASTDYLNRSGGSMLNSNLVSNLNAQFFHGQKIDAVRGLRVRHPDMNSNTAVGAVPFNVLALQTGTPLFDDPEFADGLNGISPLNHGSSTNHTLERIEDDQLSANSSGYILKMTTTGTMSPGWGGFVQYYNLRANAIFLQVFRAKIPVGYNVVGTKGSAGTYPTDVWLTTNDGTGKWEWYARMLYCDDEGSYGQGGYIYLKDGTTPTEDEPLIWYVSYAQCWDLTKGNYGTLRSKLADALSTPRYIWGQLFDGKSSITGNLRGSYFTLFDNETNPRLKLSYGNTEYFVQATDKGVSMGPVESKSLLVDLQGNVGIGTTAPTYLLDVRGRMNVSKGIQFNQTANLGWYPNDSRIAAGNDAAVGVNVGSLLVSNVWVDADKVPTNGIYSKGSIRIGDGTISWDSTNNTFVFSHTVVSQGDLVAYKDE